MIAFQIFLNFKFLMVLFSFYLLMKFQNISCKTDSNLKGREEDWPCELDRESTIKAFKEKYLLNPFPKFTTNPYSNLTSEIKKYINETLNNPNIICAIKYSNESKKIYSIQNFKDSKQAQEKGFIITHQGICGACSNLNDLAIYLSGDLTTPVRKCAFMTIFSNKFAIKCLKKLGFTEQCSQIWLYNSINTREMCFWTCMYSWIKNEPYADKNGKLNECIMCDEIYSGPVFKYFSGRSRRNSGIESEIIRPGEQIYKMNHCYY